MNALAQVGDIYCTLVINGYWDLLSMHEGEEKTIKSLWWMQWLSHVTVILFMWPIEWSFGLPEQVSASIDNRYHNWWTMTKPNSTLILIKGLF